MSAASQPSTYSSASPVYADLAATMGGGTPLIVAVSRSGMSDDYHVTVKLQLLQAYERAIFELQQQVVHYKALADGVLTMREKPEPLRLELTQLNAASIRLLNSLVDARVSGRQFRGHDEPDED